MNQSVPKICQEKTIVDLTKKTKQLLFMKKSILTSIALVLVAFAANAQTSVNHLVKVTASPVLDIQMTSTADVLFAFTSSANYEAGITNAGAAELKVKSTKPWTITSSVPALHFSSGVLLNATELPVSALTVKKSTGSTFGAINGTLTTGPKGGNGTPGNTFNIDYKLDPGYIAQDNYQIAVTYTITAI